MRDLSFYFEFRGCQYVAVGTYYTSKIRVVIQGFVFYGFTHIEYFKGRCHTRYFDT